MKLQLHSLVYKKCRTLQPDLLRHFDLLDLSGTQRPYLYINNTPCRIRYHKLRNHHIPFPSNTAGFLYYHHTPGTSLSSAEIRFRLFPSIINKDDTQPLDFTQTTDLTTPEHTPWSLTLFQLTRPQYKPFSDLLLSEKLVSSTLLDAMTGKMDRNVKRPLHYLEQPFVMDMEKVGHSLAVWDGERVSQVRFEWPPFRDHSLKANPYTGILLLRLEQATVEQAQHLLKGEVTEVARKENKSLAAAAVIRVLKILQPIRVVIPDYNMRLPIPREGELLKGLAKAKKGSPEKNAPLVIDLRNPVGVWKALKALLSPMDSNLR